MVQLSFRCPTLLIGCTVLVLIGCAQPLDPAIYSRFQRAQEAFDVAKSKEDFLRVAGMYQQILQSGIQSGTLFYNQGNAFMRAGQRGRAIASYRQAQRYRPRDPLLDANLRSALQGDRLVSSSQPLIEYILFWQNWISYPAKFKTTAVACLATLVLGTVGLLQRNVVWKRLAVAMLLVSIAFTASAVYDWYRFDYVGHGVVVVPEAIARKGNATSYEPAFTAPLPEGTEFVVLEKRGDWLRVRVPGSQEGWLRAMDVVEY